LVPSSESIIEVTRPASVLVVVSGLKKQCLSADKKGAQRAKKAGKRKECHALFEDF